MKKYLFLLFIIPQILFSQDNKLDFFEKLMHKTWQAEGTWGDGSTFKQTVTFEYALDGNIVITHTDGFVDKEHKIFGARNHGIRKYDSASKEIHFWEFDIFGGTTEGVVRQVEGNILYQYEYGTSLVTDMWEYVNDSTYNFKIGEYENGVWKQIYLNTQFKTTQTVEAIYASLKEKLVGDWSSKAWDGQLNESWWIDENGHLRQTATYLENGKVLYEAINKIELVDGEIILFTIIKNSNPKIFKATAYAHDKIVFENADYKNPNKVVYDFKTKKEFQRTISGTENDQPSTYTFKFEPMEK